MKFQLLIFFRSGQEICSSLLFLLLAVCCVAPLHATSVVEVTMEEMLQNSALVFEGRVIDVKVREHGNSPIQTRITFEIVDII